MKLIEAIFKSRGTKKDGFRKGTWIYKCLWKGYSVDAASWQPAKDVSNELIQAYEKEHGSPHSSYAEESGHERAAAPNHASMSLAGRQALHRDLFGSDDSDYPESEHD